MNGNNNTFVTIGSCFLVNVLFFGLVSFIGDWGSSTILYFILLPIIGLLSGIILGSKLGYVSQVYTVAYVLLSIYFYQVSGIDMEFKYVIANGLLSTFMGGYFGNHLKTMDYSKQYEEVLE